ncbi:hypothetical protein CGC21_30015 [Leishmania donovani]|nr:hypothetical protein CGC21_30015 [Leishmania donovani]
MAGGKSSKRVKLRTKIARRQQTQHATDEHAPSSSGLSSSPPPVGGAGEATAAPPTEVDRQAALHIRDALRQRQGRTGRAPAMKVKEARGVRATAAPVGAKRKHAMNAKKDKPSSQRTAALRRATVLERRRLTLPRMSAAETRMTVAQEELQLFDAVQTVPAYAEDPFAAVMQHLSATMDVLQPQTPDVGIAARAVGARRRHSEWALVDVAGREEGLAARPCTLWLVHRLQESALPEGRVQPQPLPTKTLSTTEPGSVLLVHPGAVSSSSLAGPFRPSAIAGAMRRVSSASDSGVGAGVACESMTLTSLLPAAHPQARCSPRRWQARSGLRSSAMQGLPTPALSSSAAAADAPPAVAATTSGAVSLQTRNAGPSNQAATPLASSYSSHDSDAASPSASHTGAHRTTAGPTHAEGRDVAGALAANLAQVDVSVMSGGCSAPMRPSSHTSPSAAQDVPVYLSATTSDAACTTRSSTQLMLAAAPTLAATANSSASPYTSTVWWAFTTPPFRHSPQVRYTCHSTDPIGMGTGSGGRLSVTLPGYIAAGTAAASDAAESVEPRPRLTGTLSSSSSLPSSSLPVYSPSRAGSSAAVSTAGPPSMPSVNSVAAGVGNAGSGVLLFPLQASVPALRSSNPEDEAAAAELVPVLDSREETGGTDDDHRHRQSRPRGSTSSSNYATRARQQGPSLQPPESSGTADSEDKDQPARQNSRRALDDPKIFMCDTESNAPGTFLMRCEDEGSFVPESVRVRRDVDRTAYHAKAPGGNTANHSLVPGFAGFDALDDAVAAKAPVTAARGVTVQYQGESVPARSHSSSLLTFSQELQRTLPPSAVITASDHYRRLRQQATVHLPPSQASEAVDAANSTRLRATTPPLRLRAGVPLSVLPPRSSSGATQPPPTTPPAGEHERDKSVEEEVEDAAIDSAHSGETAPFLTAHSSSSSVTDSSSRSPATTSVVQQIHSHHTAFVTAASSFRTHPPPPAPVTAPSAAASTTPLESPALPSWSREKVQRLATPPLAGSGLLRLKLSATAPAAASMAQGRSPRTPGSQRESHLMSHVRVALIDARSVRSHLEELRALLPKHRTGAAGATTAQDITGAIAGHSEPAGATRRVSADTQDRQHASASSAADVRARSDEAGETGEMLGGEDSADIVHCTTALSPLNFSLLQNMLRDRKADGIGEGCGGCRNSLRARAGTGKASSQLQNVRGLYTSSLNAYRHQRLTRLTEQHLKSLWLGVSAVAKSVCGVAVEQCVEMDLIQGPALMDGQVLRFPSDTAAAAASAAPSLASLSFGASLQQQLQCARPPSPSSTASTASPNSQGPLQPSGATVSAQDGEATATKKASRGASKPPPPADLPDPMPSFHFSEAPLTAAPAEREAVAGGVQASATAATAEATVQRLASTKRDNSPLGCHRDSQRRCLDESAPLDSAMAGCDGCAPWPLLARTAVSATAASDSAITCTHGEGDARINSRSSAVAPTSLTTRANASTNTNVSTVVEHPYAHSDCYRSGDRSRSCRHHSTTSSTLLSKWSNAPTSGIIYIHNTPANLSSTTTLPSALSNNGSSSGSRMSNTPSTSFSARGGSGGYVVGTAASSLSGLPRPTASTTATTAGGGQTLYTLPSTLLQLQQQLPQHGSSSQSAPSASVDGAAPPSSSASPPHSSSSLWHSEAGGSSCPLAGSAPGPMWMLPPPSPASPPPPAAVHRGAAAAASGASGALVVAPTVPSALPSSYGATSSGVDAGASALQGLCTRSSGLAPATPFTSPSGSTLISSLLVAMPNPPPLKAPFIKVQREEVAADTAPDSHSNARVSGAQRAVAAFSVSTSGTAAHARGEFRGQSPVSSALLLTSHERPDGGGVEARTGTAAQLGSTAAVAREGMARGGTNGVSNSVGAAPALPPAIVSPYGMLAEGELCVVAPIHDSTELLAREIHGSGDTPTSSGAKPVMMPGSPLAWRGRLEARSSSSVRRSAATEASVTTAGLVPLTTNDSSEGVEELSEPFSLMRAAATPSTRGRMGVMGGVAMHFSLPSTSTPRRQPQLQHALPFSSHAGSHQQDVCLHDIRSHATTATEAQGGEAASTALPSATEQPLAPSQQHRTRSRDESVGRRDVQALPLLRSSLPLDGTTPASAVSANGDQQQADNGESDGTDAAVKASYRLAAHAAAEGPRAGKAWNNDFPTGAGSAKLRDETGTSSGFAAGHDSTASPPSPRQRQDEQDAGSVAAHPRAASAASSSLSYTTISASTADATPAAVTAISVSGTRVPSSAPSATLPAPLRAELQPGYGGDGASLTRPMNTAGSALNDLGDDEDTNTVALLMDGTRHRQLHAVLPWAQLRPPPTPTLNTASLTMYSANRADALLVRAKDMEREVDVISALMCATSLPARPGGLATGTDGSLRPSSPTSTLPARAEVVHNIPATEAEVRKTDALVMQSKGEDGTTDTPGPLAPSLALRPWATRGGRHVGVCTDSTAVALDTEHSRDLTATAQSSDKSPMAAYAGTCSGDDRGEAGEAKRRRGAVSADELAASDSEDGRDLLSLYVNSDAHDLPSSPRRAAAYQQALQQQQYHQRHLMQTWSSIFTISSSGHSAATTSSLRTAITGVALSASVAALGSRLNTSSTMSSGTPTALASVAEVILGIGAAGSVVGGGSAGGVPSGHAGAIPSIGTAATATAAAGSAAASSFTVTMIAPTTAAAANSTWTPNSTVTLSSDSASAAGFTSPSTLFGTTCKRAGTNRLRLPSSPFNSASASAESTQYVLSRLKPLPHLPPPHNYPFLLPEVTSPCLRDDDGFGEDEDDADACDYTQDVDVAVLLGADSDFEPEERHRATAPVRGGSDHSSRVETPCCDGAGGAGPAYDDSNAEDHGAAFKWAASSSQHHGNGKVDVGALSTQPPPDSCSNEGPTLTTVAASMRTATTDDGGAGGASLYAAVVSRTVVAHASRMGEVGRAEDDSTTEGRTSSVHLSARSLGIPTARLSAPAGAGPATTAAAGTSSAAASIIEGNEDMRVVSLPRSGEDVPIAPSWPLLCTNTASAAPRSPRIVSNSPLRLRSAVTITAGGDALVVSTATTAMAAAERERAGAQTNRSASRPHHLSGGGSALIQDGMPASNSNSGNYGGVCGRLFPQKPNPPEAALEEGGSWAEVAATTVSEDTANALVTPGLPAMQHSSQRQTSSCAPMVSSVTSMAVGDSEGLATLRDGGGLDAGPAVTKAVRAEPTAFLFDDGGIEQPNRKYVGHRENTLVGEGGASTAVEGRSDRPGADRSISIEGDAAAFGAAPDAGHASRITSTPLAMTPALRAAGILGSDGAVLRLLRDAARSTCEDGLADVAGSLHGWHATTSAFFSGADTAAAPGQTRGRSSSPSSRSSDLYTSVSALARRRAQQRVFYNDARLSDSAAPSHTMATTADTPLPASAMPGLSPRLGATADHSENAATPPTSPSAAAGATHNDRLVALMRAALRLTDGESGAC